MQLDQEQHVSFNMGEQKSAIIYGSINKLAEHND